MVVVALGSVQGWGLRPGASNADAKKTIMMSKTWARERRNMKQLMMVLLAAVTCYSENCHYDTRCAHNDC